MTAADDTSNRLPPAAAQASDPNQVIASEIERLRRDCAEAYQVIGVLGMQPTDFNDQDVARALDNLAAAANGSQRPHEDLLPWPKAPATQATVTGSPAGLSTAPAAQPFSLASFAREVLAGFPESFPDGFEIQDIAIKHGLLVGQQVHAPCREEGCTCAEYHGAQEMAEGVTCYRRHPALAGSSAAAQDQVSRTANPSPGK